MIRNDITKLEYKKEDKYIALVKEITPAGIRVEEIFKGKEEITKEDINKLSLRSRLNPGLDYYILVLKQEILEQLNIFPAAVDCFITNIKDDPELLERSEMIYKL